MFSKYKTQGEREYKCGIYIFSRSAIVVKYRTLLKLQRSPQIKPGSRSTKDKTSNHTFTKHSLISFSISFFKVLNIFYHKSLSLA